MEQWYLYKKKADFNQIGEKFNIDPVIARLIRNRDISLIGRLKLGNAKPEFTII